MQQEVHQRNEPDMDPVTVLHIADTAVGIARTAYGVGVSLYSFMQDTRKVDQTLEGLVSDTNSLGDACELLGKRMRIITHKHSNARQVGGWACVDSQVHDCRKTMLQLQKAVSSVEDDKRNFFAQARRQIELNMKAKDIGEVRNRIQSHAASLRLVLQAVAM